MSEINVIDEINNIDEVLEALRKVKKYCNSIRCGECKFTRRDGRCGIVCDTPNNWRLEGRTYYM